MKFDKEKAIREAMVDGIVDIDQLLICNDYETIKDGLTNYPLTTTEYLEKLFREGKKRKIFEYAVDYGLNNVADWCVIPNDKIFSELIATDIYERKRYNHNFKFINDNYFYANRDGYYDFHSKPTKTHDEVREEILKELSLKIDKQTITKGLTEEYFKGLLEQGNIEILVIKLCVRLEAVLKCDFHYEGTFEEMLSQYSANTRQYDDWNGDCDSKESECFHKLRKYRNDIVHAQKNGIEMSKEELDEAIEYVCQLG